MIRLIWIFIFAGIFISAQQGANDMSDLIQITTPAAPREYGNQNFGNRQQNIEQNPTGQVFDLGNQTQIVKTNDRGGDNAQQDLKDESGTAVLMRQNMDAVKNPSAAINTAKELLSRETVALIKESGDTETLNKVTEFASEVMLTPETVSSDMVNQQDNSTIFGDKLWNILKAIIDTSGSEEIKEAVITFAGTAADLSAKDEILRSLSANFRYLAVEAAPSKAVANELLSASKALSGLDAEANFAALKPTLLKLIGYTEQSLLLNDDTKNLLPLIVHTMSRYNDDPNALKESFDSLMKMTESLDYSPEQLEQIKQQYNVTGLDPKKSLGENLARLFDKYVTGNQYLSPKARLAALIDPETAKYEGNIQSAVTLLSAGAKHMAARISPEKLSEILETVDFTEGASALQKVLGAVIPNTPAMRNALQTIFNDLELTGDLNRMIDHLNTILENIGGPPAEMRERDIQNSQNMQTPDAAEYAKGDNMMKLAQGLNETLGGMVESGRYKFSTPTSMETLTDFLTKNIDNSFLQRLSGMNSSDMVHNMLTAPGVFTPLLHHFVPLDAFGIRAFGELWVDPNAEELDDRVGSSKKGVGGAAGSHIFLCFDVEDTGYFELEMYEQNKNLSVMLLCPENLEGVFRPIRETIPKIAAENGYKVTAAIVEKMRAKRGLDQVFPKLNETRSSLNVRI